MIETIALVSFLGFLGALLAWAASRAELVDALRHGEASEGVRVELVKLLERSKKQNVVYLAALREQKIRADKYRGVARKLSRKMREQNEASKPAEIFYGESLQAVTAVPMFPRRRGADKIKVGG